MSDNTTGPFGDLATDLYIGGKAVPATGGRRFDVVDPATGRTITTVADAGVEDAIAAIDAAEEAAPAWAATPPRQRAEILRRAFELMIDGTEDLARHVELGFRFIGVGSDFAYVADGAAAAVAAGQALAPTGRR